ncbi:hypothetical protein BHE74_00057985, partial [Ensete ventricosum]
PDTDWCRLARALPLQERLWGYPLRPGRERCLPSQLPPLQAPTMPAGDREYWRLPVQGALAVAGRPLTGALAAAGLAMCGQPCMGAGRPSSLPSL